jgi:isochorismate hydrolase
LFQKLLTIVYIKNKATTFTSSTIPSDYEKFNTLIASNPNILDNDLTDLFINLTTDNTNQSSRIIKNILAKKNDILINNIKLFITTSVSKKQLQTYIKNIDEERS